MAESEPISSQPTLETKPETTEPQLTDAQRIRLRVGRIGRYPEAEVRKYFTFGAPGKNDPIGPEHLFVPTLRETLIVPVDEELTRARALIADTIGVKIGSVAPPRGIQIIIGAIHNEGVIAQNKDSNLLVKDSMESEMLMPVERFAKGLDYIEEQLAKTPPNKRRELTMLDVADCVLLHLAQKRIRQAIRQR
jgi:hypothetical protein